MTTVDQAFVKQYNGNVYTLLQQKGSKLRSCFRNEDQHSEEQFWDRHGPATAQEVTTRFGDSPMNEIEHSRRRVTLRFFDHGIMIDSFDRVKMLQDPGSSYVTQQGYALGRSQDDIALEGLFGSAWTGKGGTVEVTFPAGQVVALNFGGVNVGLTIEKLIEAKRLLMAANVDFDAEEIYIGCSSKGLADLLNTTQVQSADYNNVKALVEGKVDRLLGFTFKFTERILKDGAATYWRYPVWCKSGTLFANAIGIQTEVAKRPDKRFNWYAYAKAGFGFVRMEEEKVVEIRGLV
jgi:hypothetical protein